MGCCCLVFQVANFELKLVFKSKSRNFVYVFRATSTNSTHFSKICKFLFCFQPDSTCWGPLREKFVGYFFGRGSPSAFNRIASAEDSPFQKTRLFGKYSMVTL